MKLEQAQAIAQSYVDMLKPYCQRIEIAGSIRRQKPEVKDIEIVCIIKDLEGFTQAVNSTTEKVKGEPTGRYTQRMLPEGIKLDLFIAQEGNWGNIFAMRTGSADFSHKTLAWGWNRAGYTSENGYLKNKTTGEIMQLKEEQDLFDLIGLKWVDPKDRI